MVHSLTNQPPGFRHELVLLMRRIISPVQAALAGHPPSLNPIAKIKRAIDAEFHIGGQDAPQKVAGVRQFKRSAIGRKPEGMDATVGGPATKIDQEKMIARLLVQSRPGII